MDLPTGCVSHKFFSHYATKYGKLCDKTVLQQSNVKHVAINTCDFHVLYLMQSLFNVLVRHLFWIRFKYKSMHVACFGVYFYVTSQLFSSLFPCDFTWLRVYINVTSPDGEYIFKWFHSESTLQTVLYIHVPSPFLDSISIWQSPVSKLFACGFTCLRVYIRVTSPVSESISTSSSLSPCPPFMSQSATYDTHRVHNV